MFKGAFGGRRGCYDFGAAGRFADAEETVSFWG
jgi:hypothetical protein